MSDATALSDATRITPVDLIAAGKVSGSNVYDRTGAKIGTIADIMIDKVSGRALYAVMSFGGFLGMGAKYHPLPWASLNYDAAWGGYVVDMDPRQLDRAPYYDRDSVFEWTPDYGRKVDDFYKAADNAM